MNNALRPMSLGEILDRTLQIYRSRFWLFFAIASFPVAVMAALQFLNLFWWHLPSPFGRQLLPGLDAGTIWFTLGEYHVNLLVHAFAWPALAIAAARANVGEEITVRSAYAACTQRWRGWLGIVWLLWSVVLLLPELAGAGLLIGVGFLGDWITHDGTVMDALMNSVAVLMVLAAFVASVWLGSVYLAAIPVWVVEGTGARKSLARARVLSKDGRWQVTLARMMPPAIAIVLNLLLVVLIRYGMIALARATHHWLIFFGKLYRSANFVGSGIVATLLGPVFPIALTLLYYDQRIRKEGFDIEWMMAVAGMDATTDAVPAAGQSEPDEVASVPVEGARV